MSLQTHHPYKVWQTHQKYGAARYTTNRKVSLAGKVSPNWDFSEPGSALLCGLFTSTRSAIFGAPFSKVDSVGVL